MHPSSLLHARNFFTSYGKDPTGKRVMDIGSQNINGAVKDVLPAGMLHTGVDFVAGNNVDVVLSDPYALPFADESFDVVTCSSCFEHSEMFWLLFLELLRVLRPEGLIYLNVPSNGIFHRYPVDCWRFYPDSGRALVTWARRSGYSPALLESFIGSQYFGLWNDFVAVFVKNEEMASRYPNRMITLTRRFSNAFLPGEAGYLRPSSIPEDQEGVRHSLLRHLWSRVEPRVMARLKRPAEPA